MDRVESAAEQSQSQRCTTITWLYTTLRRFLDGHGANLDILRRPVPGILRNLGNFLDHIIALDHLSEDRMLVIEPGSFSDGDEKLASVGVRAGVGHGEY